MHFFCALPSLLEKCIRKRKEALTFHLGMCLRKDVPTSEVSVCLLIHWVISLALTTQLIAKKPCVLVSAFLNKIFRVLKQYCTSNSKTQSLA